MAKKPVNDFDFLTVEYPRRLRVTKQTARKKIHQKKPAHYKKAHVAKRTGRFPIQRVEYFNEFTPKQSKSKPRKAKSVPLRPIERRADVYSETIPAPFEYEDCVHEHHMNCIRCGLVQFLIGFVTGLTMALLMARILF